MPSLIFNSEAWTDLSQEDLRKLQSLQLKFLKKIVQAPRCTTSCFIFLEFGVLPIKQEIDQRKLMFLHHVLSLQNDDPVKRMYNILKDMPGKKNWAKECYMIRELYRITYKDEDVQKMKRETWKNIVKGKIQDYAISVLTEEKETKKKVRQIEHKYFEPQLYLKSLKKKDASTLFKIRSQVLEIKSNERYLHQDMSCRLCDAPEEDLSHVLKCKELINKNEECKNFGSEIFFQDVNKLNIAIVKEHLQVVEKFLEEVQKRN